MKALPSLRSPAALQLTVYLPRVYAGTTGNHNSSEIRALKLQRLPIFFPRFILVHRAVSARKDLILVRSEEPPRRLRPREITLFPGIA